jgi:type II secretory pathway pseudopilin PulG
MNRKIARENIKSLTLIELLVSIIILSIMVLTIYGIYTFSQSQVLNADRRTKVQNELSYALEHMSKYVQQANGSLSRNAIQYVGATGFRVYIDLNPTQTPSVSSDDGWIDYTLSSNTLTATCTANGGTCPFVTENLTDKIIAGVVVDTIMPNSPTSGFYIKIGSLTDTLGTFVDIGLVGRYYPTVATSLATRFRNPQVEMKTKLICNNSSTN